jgi:hypothetical protein
LDKSSDIHSSKNIGIPLNPGLLLTLLDDKPITSKTKVIRLKVTAEEGFNPQSDIDVESLRFGASEEVNFGRGSRVLKTENDGKDLIVTFDAAGNGITETEFAPKLIGRYKNGKMLYGYARLPYIDYIEPILSARAPVITESLNGASYSVEVQNFGQVTSSKASVKIAYTKDGKTINVATGDIPVLAPYEKVYLQLSGKTALNKGYEYDITVTIFSGKKVLSTLSLEKYIFK